MSAPTPERCAWATPGDALYEAYHDTEWGVPERGDRALYEKLVLDGFQAGLSWRTILHKRAAFREAFAGFEPERIAGWGEAEVTRLLGNAAIVRSRAKIEAAIGNAKAWRRVMDEEPGGFAGWLWGFYGGETRQNAWPDVARVPARTAESEAMAKALKARGFAFCGPVIVYAFAQAVGMVNDHVTTCPRHAALGGVADI